MDLEVLDYDERPDDDGREDLELTVMREARQKDAREAFYSQLEDERRDGGR